MPLVSLGDRNAMLAFVATQLPANKNVQLEFNLLDNKTGNNIHHTTYLVIVSHENQRLFTETVHSHNGHILMEFVPSKIEPYRMNPNFDTLSASYIADYSGPIKVIGNIFSPGNYTVSIEVTDVDLDNLFIPIPLKFEFPVSIPIVRVHNFVKIENDVRKIFLSIMNTLLCDYKSISIIF